MVVVTEYMELHDTQQDSDSGKTQKDSQQSSDNDQIVSINETEKQRIRGEFKVLADQVNLLFI